MAEMSTSHRARARAVSTDAPERLHLVAAVGAVIDEDPVAVAVALQAAVDASSWGAVERRVDVAVRALSRDAELEPWRGPIDADATPLPAPSLDVVPDMALEPGFGPAVDQGLDQPVGQVADPDGRRTRWPQLWRDVHVVARLAQRAGYPPEIMA